VAPSRRADRSALRGRRPALRLDRALLCPATTGRRGRAPLPDHGPEPLAGRRPGSAGQLLRRGLPGLQSRPARAALRRAEKGRPAVSGSQPRTPRAARTRVRLWWEGCVCLPAGAARCLAHGRGVSRRSGAHERRRCRAGGLGRVARATDLLLLLPHVHGGAVGPRDRPGAPIQPGGEDADARCASGRADLNPALAPRQDDPRGAGPGDRLPRAASASSVARLRGDSPGDGHRLSRLLPDAVRSADASGHLRWSARRHDRSAHRCDARAASGPVVRAAAPRSRVPTGSRELAGAGSGEALRGSRRGARRGRAAPRLAHVVGGDVPASPFSRADPALDGRRRGAPGSGVRSWAREVALAARRRRAGARDLHDPQPGRSTALEPARPAHARLDVAGRRCGSRSLPAFIRGPR